MATSKGGGPCTSNNGGGREIENLDILTSQILSLGESERLYILSRIKEGLPLSSAINQPSPQAGNVLHGEVFAPEDHERSAKDGSHEDEGCGAKDEECGAKDEECGAKDEECGAKDEECGAKDEECRSEECLCAAELDESPCGDHESSHTEQKRTGSKKKKKKKKKNRRRESEQKDELTRMPIPITVTPCSVVVERLPESYLQKFPIAPPSGGHNNDENESHRTDESTRESADENAPTVVAEDNASTEDANRGSVLVLSPPHDGNSWRSSTRKKARKLSPLNGSTELSKENMPPSPTISRSRVVADDSVAKEISAEATFEREVEGQARKPDGEKRRGSVTDARKMETAERNSNGDCSRPILHDKVGSVLGEIGGSVSETVPRIMEVSVIPKQKDLVRTEGRNCGEGISVVDDSDRVEFQAEVLKKGKVTSRIGPKCTKRRNCLIDASEGSKQSDENLCESGLVVSGKEDPKLKKSESKTASQGENEEKSRGQLSLSSVTTDQIKEEKQSDNVVKKRKRLKDSETSRKEEKDDSSRKRGRVADGSKAGPASSKLACNAREECGSRSSDTSNKLLLRDSHTKEEHSGGKLSTANNSLPLHQNLPVPIRKLPSNMKFKRKPEMSKTETRKTESPSLEADGNFYSLGDPGTRSQQASRPITTARVDKPLGKEVSSSKTTGPEVDRGEEEPGRNRKEYVKVRADMVEVPVGSNQSVIRNDTHEIRNNTPNLSADEGTNAKIIDIYSKAKPRSRECSSVAQAAARPAQFEDRFSAHANVPTSQEMLSKLSDAIEENEKNRLMRSVVPLKTSLQQDGIVSHANSTSQDKTLPSRNPVPTGTANERRTSSMDRIAIRCPADQKPSGNPDVCKRRLYPEEMENLSKSVQSAQNQMVNVPVDKVQVPQIISTCKTNEQSPVKIPKHQNWTESASSSPSSLMPPPDADFKSRKTAVPRKKSSRNVFSPGNASCQQQSITPVTPTELIREVTSQRDSYYTQDVQETGDANEVLDYEMGWDTDDLDVISIYYNQNTDPIPGYEEDAESVGPPASPLSFRLQEVEEVEEAVEIPIEGMDEEIINVEFLSERDSEDYVEVEDKEIADEPVPSTAQGHEEQRDGEEPAVTAEGRSKRRVSAEPQDSEPPLKKRCTPSPGKLRETSQSTGMRSGAATPSTNATKSTSKQNSDVVRALQPVVGIPSTKQTVSGGIADERVVSEPVRTEVRRVLSLTQSETETRETTIVPPPAPSTSSTRTSSEQLVSPLRPPPVVNEVVVSPSYVNTYRNQVGLAQSSTSADLPIVPLTHQLPQSFGPVTVGQQSNTNVLNPTAPVPSEGSHRLVHLSGDPDELISRGECDDFADLGNYCPKFLMDGQGNGYHCVCNGLRHELPCIPRGKSAENVMAMFRRCLKFKHWFKTSWKTYITYFHHLARPAYLLELAEVLWKEDRFHDGDETVWSTVFRSFQKRPSDVAVMILDRVMSLPGQSKNENSRKLSMWFKFLVRKYPTCPSWLFVTDLVKKGYTLPMDIVEHILKDSTGRKYKIEICDFLMTFEGLQKIPLEAMNMFIKELRHSEISCAGELRNMYEACHTRNRSTGWRNTASPRQSATSSQPEPSLPVFQGHFNRDYGLQGCSFSLLAPQERSQIEGPFPAQERKVLPLFKTPGMLGVTVKYEDDRVKMEARERSLNKTDWSGSPSAEESMSPLKLVGRLGVSAPCDDDRARANEQGKSSNKTDLSRPLPARENRVSPLEPRGLPSVSTLCEDDRVRANESGKSSSRTGLRPAFPAQEFAVSPLKTPGLPGASAPSGNDRVGVIVQRRPVNRTDLSHVQRPSHAQERIVSPQQTSADGGESFSGAGGDKKLVSGDESCREVRNIQEPTNVETMAGVPRKRRRTVQKKMMAGNGGQNADEEVYIPMSNRMKISVLINAKRFGAVASAILDNIIKARVPSDEIRNEIFEGMSGASHLDKVKVAEGLLLAFSGKKLSDGTSLLNYPPVSSVMLPFFCWTFIAYAVPNPEAIQPEARRSYRDLAWKIYSLARQKNFDITSEMHNIIDVSKLRVFLMILEICENFDIREVARFVDENMQTLYEHELENDEDENSALCRFTKLFKEFSLVDSSIEILKRLRPNSLPQHPEVAASFLWNQFQNYLDLFILMLLKRGAHQESFELYRWAKENDVFVKNNTVRCLMRVLTDRDARLHLVSVESEYAKREDQLLDRVKFYLKYYWTEEEIKYCFERYLERYLKGAAVPKWGIILAFVKESPVPQPNEEEAKYSIIWDAVDHNNLLRVVSILKNKFDSPLLGKCIGSGISIDRDQIEKYLRAAMSRRSEHIPSSSWPLQGFQSNAAAVVQRDSGTATSQVRASGTLSLGRKDSNDYSRRPKSGQLPEMRPRSVASNREPYCGETPDNGPWGSPESAQLPPVRRPSYTSGENHFEEAVGNSTQSSEINTWRENHHGQAFDSSSQSSAMRPPSTSNAVLYHGEDFDNRQCRFRPGAPVLASAASRTRKGERLNFKDNFDNGSSRPAEYDAPLPVNDAFRRSATFLSKNSRGSGDSARLPVFPRVPDIPGPSHLLAGLDDFPEPDGQVIVHTHPAFFGSDRQYQRGRNGRAYHGNNGGFGRGYDSEYDIGRQDTRPQFVGVDRRYQQNLYVRDNYDDQSQDIVVHSQFQKFR